jgi:DNA-binding XRE family transcriptional regulator
LARKRLEIPPLLAETMAFMQELMPALTASRTEQDALKVLRNVFAHHPDALTNPIVRWALGAGLEMIKLGNADLITGAEMRILRVKRGLNQAEIAKELGVSGPFISKMEKSQTPIPEKYRSQINRILQDTPEPKKRKGSGA